MGLAYISSFLFDIERQEVITLTPKERIALKEARARMDALKKMLRSYPAFAKLPIVQEVMAKVNNPNSTSDELNDAVDVIEGWLGTDTNDVPNSNPKPKGRGQVPGKFEDTDKVANEKATLGRERPKSANVWKDVNDWRDVTDYRVQESDRNANGLDGTLIRIMIPKRKGVEVMNDVERIEQEIGALSHHITYVEGTLAGETGAQWAVDFTIRWDFAYSDSGSVRYQNSLIKNIENNISGIGKVSIR